MNILSNISNVFLAWTTLKINRHLKKNNKNIFFREKEVWWAALGKNIGYEIDGKNNQFSRPVLILRKYSSDMCFVLPLTTQIKEKTIAYQFIIELDKTKSAVVLSQGRTISSHRLISKKGIVSVETFIEIRSAFITYLTKNDAPHLWSAEQSVLSEYQIFFTIYILLNRVKCLMIPSL